MRSLLLPLKSRQFNTLPVLSNSTPASAFTHNFKLDESGNTFIPPLPSPVQASVTAGLAKTPAPAQAFAGVVVTVILAGAVIEVGTTASAPMVQEPVATLPNWSCAPNFTAPGAKAVNAGYCVAPPINKSSR